MTKKIEIDSHDIMRINEKSASTARKQIRDLKKSLNRLKHQKVSIREYCNYFGFDYDDVASALAKPAFKKVSKVV